MTAWVKQVVSDLARHEGFREFAYPDPLSLLGKKYRSPKYRWGFVPGDVLLAKYGEKEADGRPWTYGYGFTGGVQPSSRINRQFADQKLTALAMEHSKILDRLIPSWTKMPLFAQTVLVNMAYNMGNRLAQFKDTLAVLAAGKFAEAGHRLRLSAWYKQTGNRAEELIKRLETGSIEPEHKV